MHSSRGCRCSCAVFLADRSPHRSLNCCLEVRSLLGCSSNYKEECLGFQGDCAGKSNMMLHLGRWPAASPHPCGVSFHHLQTSRHKSRGSRTRACLPTTTAHNSQILTTASTPSLLAYSRLQYCCRST